MGITFGRTKHKHGGGGSSGTRRAAVASSSSGGGGGCRLPRCICGCDQLSRTDVDRYTDRLDNVLHCARGREVFRNFLRVKGLTEAARSLEFWERCERPPSPIAREAEPGARIAELLRLAEDIDDLDFAAVERLNNCAQRSAGEGDYDHEETRECLKDLQRLIMNSLRDEYELFRNYLLEKRQR